MKIHMIFFILLLGKLSYAQNLCKHKSFFKSEINAYVEWINTTQISDVAHYDNLKITKNKVIVYLKSNFQTDDSLKIAWNNLDIKYQTQYSYSIGEKILNTLTFLFDLEPTQAEIIIIGNQFDSSKIRIHYDSSDVKIEDEFPNVMVGGTFEVLLDKLTFTKTNNECTVQNGVDIKQAREYVESVLKKYYEDKGTYFYPAHIDSSRSYLKKFIYHITCVKNEILDNGYYEFIKVEVNFFASKDKLEVSYDVTGKYASGILCPGKGKKFYKSVETNYSSELEDYAEHIGYLIQDALQNP